MRPTLCIGILLLTACAGNTSSTSNTLKSKSDNQSCSIDRSDGGLFAPGNCKQGYCLEIGPNNTRCSSGQAGSVCLVKEGRPSCGSGLQCVGGTDKQLGVCSS